MKEIVLIFMAFSLITAYLTEDRSKIVPALKTVPVRHLRGLPSRRVVGGHEAPKFSLPYQAFMNCTDNEFKSVCGGALITRRYVLTAAHCLNDRVKSIIVILGAHNINQKEQTQQHFETSTFKIHEKFEIGSGKNDIATVKLPRAAILNRYVQLIALPSTADKWKSFVKSKAVTSGWGSVSNNHRGSDVLQYVELLIISNNECKGWCPSITDSIICTAGTGYKGTCYGDSGGPLVVNNKLVGIVSFGCKRNCENEGPDGFTRVSKFLHWIARNSDAALF